MSDELCFKNKDFQGLQLKKYSEEQLSAAPTDNLFISRKYYNISSNKLFMYNGTSWEEIGAGGSGGGAVDSVNGETGDVVLDADDIDDTTTTNKFTNASDISKLAGIEAGAEVNNISDVNATLLTGGENITLHNHDSRYYTESEVDTLLSAKQDNLTSSNFGLFSTQLSVKNSPIDADTFNIVDSAASNVAKKLSWSNIKSSLKSYFDTLYQTILTNPVTSSSASPSANHFSLFNGTGNQVSPINGTEATALLSVVAGDSGSGGTKGLVPAPAAGDAAGNKYLKADGTWAPVSGGSASDSDFLANSFLF